MKLRVTDTNTMVGTGAMVGVIPGGGTAEKPNIELRFNINKFFTEYNRNNIPVNSYYPIVQKRMPGALSNIKIEGRMSTNYAGTTEGSATHGYSLIQVGKSSTGLANALGGYGVAWKPLTSADPDTTAYLVTKIQKVGIGEYEVTLNPGTTFPGGGFTQEGGHLQIPYRSTSTFVFVPIQFTTYKTATVFRCLSGNTELLDGVTAYDNVALYLTKPNVFILDYTSSVNDINLWDNLSDEMGFLSFLNCGVANLKPDLEYDFALTITEDNGLEFVITDPAFSISAPARMPMYDYVAAEDTDSVAISVYGTDGYQWYYDDIKISSLNAQYPYLYCVFGTEGLRDEIYLKLIGRGYKDGGADTGLKVYVLASDGNWELIGYNTGGDMDTITSDVINRDDYIFRNRINVLVMGDYPGDDEGNSILEVDWISVENSESIATHIGGFVDAYIDAPLTPWTYTLTPDTELGTIYLDNSSRAIVHILSLERNGITLSQNTDYILGLDEYSLTCRGSITIKTRYYDGTINVNTLICPGLITINSGIAAKSLTPLGYDLLVKHRNVHYLDVISTQRTTIIPYLTDYVGTLPRVNGQITLAYTNFAQYLIGKNLAIDDMVITDTYLLDAVIKKDYLRVAGDAVVLDKISAFRVSDGS